MALPFEALDGQYLESVSYDSDTKSVVLTFDLGADLRLSPCGDLGDQESQWTICSIDNIYREFLLSGEVRLASGDDLDAVDK
jgi:hypothetical protein